jgi:hypothetical protein
MITMSSRTVLTLLAIAAGAGLTMLLLPQSRHRRWRQLESHDDESRRVDEAAEESFPASDPPSFSAPATAPAVDR